MKDSELFNSRDNYWYLPERWKPTHNINYGEDLVCTSCGKDFKSFRPERSRRWCPSCWQQHCLSVEEMEKEFAILKHKLSFEHALRKMELSVGVFEIEDMTASISAIKEMFDIKPDAFKSSYEIITAIFLYDDDIFFKLNHKVLNYEIDFFLPDEHICLEIDGAWHNTDAQKIKDGKRDILVREELGADWETVRIPTKLIDRHPERIIEAMISLSDKQRKTRRKHNGMLPENYSQTTKAYYNSICPDVLAKVYKK